MNKNVLAQLPRRGLRHDLWQPPNIPSAAQTIKLQENLLSRSQTNKVRKFFLKKKTYLTDIVIFKLFLTRG